MVCSCGLETWTLGPGEADWQPGRCLLAAKPDWVARELPGNDGAYWAPALASPTVLYYSGDRCACAQQQHPH